MPGREKEIDRLVGELDGARRELRDCEVLLSNLPPADADGDLGLGGEAARKE